MIMMKNRTVAVLLAMFAGWCGMHRFYLGDNLAGVFYFLFAWTGIPAVIAFFETIGLALMGDPAFEAKYNGRLIGHGTYPQPYLAETTRDKAIAIAELKNLYDMGAITAEEFEAKRRKLLDSI
jgi:TM2 domain-containing membrane protein YozV